MVDIGIATITAFVNKKDPSLLTIEDLDAIAEYMERNYVVDPLKSFLTVAFPNSGFTQPAYERDPKKRVEYARKIIRAYRPDTPTLEERCIFTGKPAVAVSLDLKDALPLGRAYRQHIPLATGEGVINFHPYGNAGVPVSGEALLAIQAFPLGCAKVAGRLLAVHADDAEITYRFTRNFLIQNRKAIQTAQLSGEKKLEEPLLRTTTLLIETLLAIEKQKQEAGEENRPVSITAYHLSNSGQGVGLDIYYLPLEITDFLRTAITPRYNQAWDRLCYRGWEITEAKSRKKGQDVTTQPQQNVLYEDLFKLPEDATLFIRRYFLRIPDRGKFPGDPRSTYSLLTEANLVSWNLTELFLRKVVSMNKERIEQIRKLGDDLAEYINNEKDKRFFHSFLTALKYDVFRSILIRLNVAQMKRGKAPLITFDPFIDIFEIGEELPYNDWRLARDLVLIRMIEKLHELGWIQANIEELPEPEAVLDEGEN